MFRWRLFLLVLILLIPIVSACQLEPAAATNPTATPVDTQAGATASAPDATSAAQATAPLVVPTAAAGTGVVHGVLLQAETQEPFRQGLDIYLAELGAAEGDGAEYAKLDRFTAPSGRLDQNGTFVFENVLPGRYALAAVTPLNQQVVIPDAQQPDKALVVTVEAAEVLDLGTLILNLTY